MAQYVKNPQTGRRIRAGGPIHRSLLESGAFESAREPGPNHSLAALRIYEHPDLFRLILEYALTRKTSLALLLTSKRTKRLVEERLTPARKASLLFSDRLIARKKGTGVRASIEAAKDVLRDILRREDRTLLPALFESIPYFFLASLASAHKWSGVSDEGSLAIEQLKGMTREYVTRRVFADLLARRILPIDHREKTLLGLSIVPVLRKFSFDLYGRPHQYRTTDGRPLASRYSCEGYLIPSVNPSKPDVQYVFSYHANLNRIEDLAILAA